MSRVINGSGYVAEKTREKIENAIHELEYTPNELARNLSRTELGSSAFWYLTWIIRFFQHLQERRRLLSIIKDIKQWSAIPSEAVTGSWLSEYAGSQYGGWNHNRFSYPSCRRIPQEKAYHSFS